MVNCGGVGVVSCCEPGRFARRLGHSSLTPGNFSQEDKSRALESGAEATAVQTLRAVRGRWPVAKRLDCGAFTAAFCTARKFPDAENFHHK